MRVLPLPSAAVRTCQHVELQASFVHYSRKLGAERALAQHFARN